MTSNKCKKILVTWEHKHPAEHSQSENMKIFSVALSYAVARTMRYEVLSDEI